MGDGLDESRVRQLEIAQAATLVRLEKLEESQSASWQELRRIGSESRAELHEFRNEHQKQMRDLMTAVHSNKIAWSMMSSGTRVVAWVILALASIGGALAGVLSTIKRFME